MMSEKPIAVDSMLDMCAKKQRRVVLGVLVKGQQSLSVNDLAEATFNHNLQDPSIDVSENVLTDIRLSLYHVDLPKLAAEGFIDYDREHELVEPTEQLDQVQSTLSAVLDADLSAKAPIEP